MHGSTFVVETSEQLSNKGHESQIKKLLPIGSINVSCIATVGLVTMNAFPSHTNQQINSIVTKQEYSRYYLFFTMKKLEERFVNEASGGSATLNMNTSTFGGIKILKPNETALKTFNKLSTPLMNQILQNQLENLTLIELRDFLLPKLISGEIRIKQAAKKLEEVL